MVSFDIESLAKEMALKIFSQTSMRAPFTCAKAFSSAAPQSQVQFVMSSTRSGCVSSASFGVNFL